MECERRVTRAFDTCDWLTRAERLKRGAARRASTTRAYDVVHPNVMDREPFARWDIFADEPAPFDVITLLQKSSFNAELIRTYAERQRAQNLLVGELSRLLEPAAEFTKLAIANIETRNLTQAVVESWKPVVGSALNEWARQRMLRAALNAPQVESSPEQELETAKIETTAEEIESFAAISKLLGSERAVEYEDTISYFKIHIAGKRTRVLARLLLSRKQPAVWVPLPFEMTTSLVGGRSVSTASGWSVVSIASHTDVNELGELFRAAYVAVNQPRAAGTA